MSFNIVETVKGLFTDEAVGKAANVLGESEGNISKAISGIIPSILGGLASKATSGGGEAGKILELAKNAVGGSLLGSLGNLVGSGGSGIQHGLDLAKHIFGDKLDQLKGAISNYAGIKESSASSLISIATPTALGVIGEHAVQNNINPGSLTHMLESQKSHIIDAIPSGLHSTLTRLTGLAAPASQISPVKLAPETKPEQKKPATRFLIPLILGILVIIALIYLFKGCDAGSKPAAVTDTVQAIKPDTTSTASVGPVSIKVKLPNGVELDAYKGGIEDALVSFLQTDYTKLGLDSLKKIWFDFDNLNFKTGSAEIVPESQHQIDNIAAILKAFPNSKIKIGGYTDKTGDEAINKKLSNERAAAVKASLDKAGVGEQVIGAEGYGSEFAKFPADAPESSRVKDRHISISVRS